MGAGPLRLAAEVVEPLIGSVEPILIESDRIFPAEIATAFRLNALVAEQVKASIGAGKFPLVFSGNCNVALGTIAGIEKERTGVIWFDAHGDFNTPETTMSGFLDGMALAIIAGRCWSNLARSIPGFNPVAGANIVHFGGRDISEAEIAGFKQASVQVCSASDIQEREPNCAASALELLRNRVDHIYLHLDVDVMDPSEARANEFSPPGGMHLDKLAELLNRIAALLKIVAVGVASYDPAQDIHHRVPPAARRLLASCLLNRITS